MKNYILVFFFSAWPAFSQSITVEYGHKQFDSLMFTKMSNHYELQKIDRSSTAPDLKLKRALPSPLAEKMLLDLERMILNEREHMSVSEAWPCTSKFIVKKQVQKDYCLDGLGRAAQSEFSNWLDRANQLFTY